MLDEETKARLHIIRTGSKALIELLEDRLSTERVEDLRGFCSAGEWGLLMDTLVAELTIGQIPVTALERDTLAEVLAQFVTPKPYYDFINDKEKVIAALNVVD